MPRWIAGHRLLHGDSYLEPGEPMPDDVTNWPTFHALRSQGSILDADNLDLVPPELKRYRALLEVKDVETVYGYGETLPADFGQRAGRDALAAMVSTLTVEVARDLDPVHRIAPVVPDADAADGSGPPAAASAPDEAPDPEAEADEPVDPDFATDAPPADAPTTETPVVTETAAVTVEPTETDGVVAAARENPAIDVDEMATQLADALAAVAPQPPTKKKG